MKIASLIACAGFAAAASAQPTVIAEQTFDLVGCTSPGNPTPNNDELSSGGMLTNSGSMNLDATLGLTFESFWFQTRDNTQGPISNIGDDNGDFIGAGSSTITFECSVSDLDDDEDPANLGTLEFIGPLNNPFGVEYNFDSATCQAGGPTDPGANEYYFQYSDTDGLVQTEYGAVDLTGLSNRQLNVYVWVRGGLAFCEPISYEASQGGEDSFFIAITDGTDTVTAVDLTSGDLNALRNDQQDGPWTLFSIDLEPLLGDGELVDPANVQLLIGADLNAGTEGVFVDEITFTSEEIDEPTGCNAADLNGDGLNTLDDILVFTAAFDVDNPSDVADLNGDGLNTLDDILVFTGIFDTNDPNCTGN